MKYAIFDAATGRILRTVTCDESQLEAQIGAGQGFAVLADGDDTTHYIKGLEPVAMPTRPSPDHYFDPETEAWTDPRSLADFKAAKWVEIKAARNAAEFGGFTWDGSEFDSDAISQSRIQGALQLAAMDPDFAIPWTLASNVVRELSAGDLRAVGIALGTHVAEVHAKARVMRDAINASSGPADLADVSW